MIRVVFVFLNLIGCMSFAAKLEIVKVTSSEIQGNQIFRGSGFAFRHDNLTYVLTSDHVVFHSNIGFRHQISSPLLGNLQGQYLISDFASGLALIQVTTDSSTTKDLYSLEQIPHRMPEKGLQTILIGYPAASDGLLRDFDGIISNPKKTSEILISVPEMIEVQKGHAEFGMSGGVAISLAGEYLGTLSHQIYSQGEGDIQNLILLIPGSQSLDWLRNYFLSKPPTAEIVQLPQDQSWQHYPTFRSGHILFSYVDTYATGSPVLLLNSAATGSDFLYARENGDLSAFETYLSGPNACSIVVSRFRRRGEIGAVRFSISSLPNLMRSLLNPDWEPLGHLLCSGHEAAVLKLEEHRQELAGFRLPTEAYKLGGLQKKIVAALTDQEPDDQTPSYDRVKPKDIDQIINGSQYTQEWLAVRKVGMEAAFVKALRGLQVTLQSLTI